MKITGDLRALILSKLSALNIAAGSMEYTNLDTNEEHFLESLSPEIFEKMFTSLTHIDQWVNMVDEYSLRTDETKETMLMPNQSKDSTKVVHAIVISKRMTLSGVTLQLLLDGELVKTYSALHGFVIAQSDAHLLCNAFDILGAEYTLEDRDA